MMNLLVNGIEYQDYLSFDLNVSVQTLSNDFNFTCTAKGGFPPFKVGDSVTVNVEGVQRFAGYIEYVTGNKSEGGHTVTYSGRDRTGDFVDSQLDALDDIRPPVNLASILQSLISNIGSDLSVIENTATKPFNRAEDLIDIQDGTDCIEVARTYAKKRQVLLTSDGNGNIVITQSEPTDSGALLRSVDGEESNIIEQSWGVSTEATFNKYIFKSQLDPRAINNAGATKQSSVVNQFAKVIDADVRAGRQMVVAESTSFSNAELVELARWERQKAKAQATQISCVVKGHLQEDGQQWRENTLVQIHSQSADIDRKMLLANMTFSQGEGSPTVTHLDFVERDVFTVDDQIENKKERGKQNEAHTQTKTNETTIETGDAG